MLNATRTQTTFAFKDNISLDSLYCEHYSRLGEANDTGKYKGFSTTNCYRAGARDRRILLRLRVFYFRLVLCNQTPWLFDRGATPIEGWRESG